MKHDDTHFDFSRDRKKVSIFVSKKNRNLFKSHMKHVLKPFSGMISGFNPDGSPTAFTAQISSLKRIGDFMPQNLASAPPYTFGYYEMLYNQVPNDNLIQVKFSLRPNRNFKIILAVTTNVINSTFTFTIAGISQTQNAAQNGVNSLSATFTGNATGQYDLLINPEYKSDFTTFLLTEITIEES